MTQDRREHPRLIPDAALLVSLGKSRKGFLSDLSEGGMAFDGLMASAEGSNTISLAFSLPDGVGLIEAVAEIVWTSDSTHRTGVRFLELAEASREKLRGWLSSRVVTIEGQELQGVTHWSSARDVSAAARNWILQEIGDTGESDAPLPDTSAKKWKLAWKLDATKRHRSLTMTAGAIGLAVMCSAFVTLGYYLPGMVLGSKMSGHITTSESTLPATFSSMDATAKVQQVSGQLSQNTASAAQNPEGFVLQVGAMARRENAEALTSKLQSKNFPAFVFEGARDGLYRVDVGPYPDPAYAHGVRDELRSAGFTTVLERRLAH